KHHYTRFLCHMLCTNLKYPYHPQACVDALHLIYRNLVESDVQLRDFDTHLYVLRTVRIHAADIRTHRLAVVVQFVVLKNLRPRLSKSVDLAEWEQLPSIFSDEAWFRPVLGLDNKRGTEIYECACVGVVTTFLEQCVARSPDQTERDLDFETLKSVHRFA
ncbi:unnamed protein product, partial [Mycena citricolor]